MKNTTQNSIQNSTHHFINIETEKSLQAFNTLRLPCVAEFYLPINQAADIPVALEFAAQQQREVLLLSGGSNILLPQQLNSAVLHLQIKGIQVLAQDDDTVLLQVGAGENWHEFVCHTTQQGYYGLQNLALIPGLVGASPVQNIGAYGVEVGECIARVLVYDRECKRFDALLQADCQFAYRDSIFKQNPTRYVIYAVEFRLQRKPQLKTQYGDLKQAMGDDLSPENLQAQVIAIRQSKLPDPAEFANVGSFFKNPIIDEAQLQNLAQHYPNMPHYAQPNAQHKVAAGWLIEQAGWKGKRLGKVGMFAKQALVLVNYADASLDDVRQTYLAVQSDVHAKFGIWLEPEPVQFAANGQILRQETL